MKHHFLPLALLIGSAAVPILHAQTAAPARPGELVNGDFSQRVGNGLPTGWSFTTTPWIDARGKEPKIPADVAITTLQEGSRAFVRTTYTDNKSGCLVQVIDVPPKSKEARFKVSVRGETEVEHGSTPQCGLRFFNAKGEFLPDPKSKEGLGKLKPRSWNDIEINCNVPPGSAFCSVVLGNARNTNGTFDFRGVSVKFR